MKDFSQRQSSIGQSSLLVWCSDFLSKFQRTMRPHEIVQIINTKLIRPRFGKFTILGTLSTGRRSRSVLSGAGRTDAWLAVIVIAPRGRRGFDTPAWMLDHAVCSTMKLSPTPFVDIEALAELRRLLDWALGKEEPPVW
jgi:hypothetical protein